MPATPPFRTAVVTGASEGIGRSLAHALARRGAHVVAVARRGDRLDALVAEIEALGGRARAEVLDVGDTAQVIERLQSLDDELSGIDLVVANAGVGRQRPASRLTWADVEPVMRVNALGAMATLVALLPRMAERGSGTLVGVSSLAALRALPATAAYGASKAALTSFIDSLRLDLRGTGVHAMTVHPGFVESAMTAKNHFKMPFLLTADAAAERMVRAIEARTPLYEFPVPTALAMHAAAWVPRWAFERAMKMPKSSAKPKAG